MPASENFIGETRRSVTLNYASLQNIWEQMGPSSLPKIRMEVQESPGNLTWFT